MSKSKGEFLTLSVLKEKGYDPLAYRYLCLTSHYRKPLVFSYEILDNASLSYQKLKQRVQSLKTEENPNETIYQEYNQKFKEYLEDDLNTSNAITLIYDLLKSDVDNGTKYALIKSWDKVLSLNLCEEKEISESLKKYIEEKIEERKKAKEEKNYALADQIREELLKQNIILKDTREKTTYEIK